MDARQRLQEVNAGVDMLLDANRRPKRGFFEKSRQQSLRAPSAAGAASRKRLALSTGKQRCMLVGIRSYLMQGEETLIPMT
jgi:hypothetical protein